MSFLARLLVSLVISLTLVLSIVFALFKGVLFSYFTDLENMLFDLKSDLLVKEMKRSAELFYYKVKTKDNLKELSRASDFGLLLSKDNKIEKKLGNIPEGVFQIINKLNLNKEFGIEYTNLNLYKVAIVKRPDLSFIILFKKIDIDKLLNWYDVSTNIMFMSQLPNFIKYKNFTYHKDNNVYYAFAFNTMTFNRIYGVFKENIKCCKIINGIFWTVICLFVISFLGCVFLIIYFNGRFLIKRINYMSKRLREISDLEDLTKRMNRVGIKEIDQLIGNINMLLNKLERNYNDFKTTMDLYYKLMSESTEVMFLFDAQTKRIIHYNNAFKRLFLYNDDDIKRLTIYDLPADNLADENLERVRRGEHYLGERPYKRKDGTIVYVEVISYFINVQGRELVSVLVRDITKQKMEKEHIAYMAYHDVLTGLLNRAYVTKELGELLSQYKFNRDPIRKVAIIMADLNDFKKINDTYGHHVGDKVLKEVAGRLKSSLRDSDIIARFGGDEFLIILPDIYRDNLQLVVQKITQMIKKPIKIDHTSIVVGISMGICVCPDDGIELNDVLEKADMAMYKAKKDMEKDWIFYNELKEA